jgi:S1-C subfamily serine protease
VGGDIILKVGGVKATSNADGINKIREIVEKNPDLKGVTFKILRAGKHLKLRIK